MSTNPGGALRERIGRGEQVLLAGAHSGLSARLVEEAGFDGIWASGFEISAQRAIPDANILTMAEVLDVSKQMAAVARIPIIADCDNGFGNAINVMRTAQEFEKAGIAGICIEDNVFPKRCSFYEGKRELASIDEHVGKVHACLAARSSRDFLIIARTEAFIAGWGLEEALKRGRAYADAGADMVLVHSKAETAAELAAFGERWDRKAPLVSVPTKYKQSTASELAALGYRMVIFANHALRSSMKAMRETLVVLREKQCCAAVEDRVASLEDVYDLVGVRRMEEDEKRFIRSGDDVRAIILAAGFDEALMPIVAERPKCMLDVKGKSILERTLATLRASGVRDVTVVRGYKKEAVDLPDVRYVDNDAYQSSGEAASLFTARDLLDGKVLVLYGDIMFEREVLEKLLRSQAPVAAVVDRSFADEPRLRMMGAAKPDLVLLSDGGADSGRYMTFDEPASIVRIDGALSPGDAHGEFVGMALFDRGATRSLRALQEKLEADPEAPFGAAARARDAALTDLIQRLIDEGTTVESVDVHGGWMDVDLFEDYRQLWGKTAS